MQSYKLKIKLLRNGEKEPKCEKCNLVFWLGCPIPLELHHIDGNLKNNDLSNLQILCPNCHTFTPNYRGRNKTKKVKVFVPDDVLIQSIRESFTIRQSLIALNMPCHPANYQRVKSLIEKNNLSFKTKPMSEANIKRLAKIKERFGSPEKLFNLKINWPSKEQLEKMIKEWPLSNIAKSLGVSCSAVRKTARKYGIDIKAISKWSQKHGR